MKIRTHTLAWSTLLAAQFAILTGASDLQADEPAAGRDADQAAVFMRAKLASSKKVIEGLVTENFDLIGKAAQEMKRMSQAAQWPTAQDKSYAHYREAFSRECDQLGRFAESKNLPGAHYTYLQLTTTCINCHEYVRKTFRISKEDPKGPVMLIPNEWEGSGQRDVPTKEARIDEASSLPVER